MELPLTEAEIEEMRAERDRVGTHTAESLRLVDRNARAADEVDRLRSLCAQMYQVAGALLFEYEGDFGVEVLDNLSDAASGNPLRHETLLPFVLPENRAKQPEDAALEGKPWFDIEQAVLKKVQAAYEDEDSDYLSDLIFNAVREVADAFGIPKDRRRAKQALRSAPTDAQKRAALEAYSDHSATVNSDALFAAVEAAFRAE